MAATRRLQKELGDITSELTKMTQELCFLDNIKIKDQCNVLVWTAVIRPTEAGPYKEGSFLVQLTFPTEYPFKPPTVQFITPIYHPNVDEKGQVCLPVISPQNWKPATKIKQVLICLHCLINKPELDHPLRSDLAQQCRDDRSTFDKIASEHTRTNATHKDES